MRFAWYAVFVLGAVPIDLHLYWFRALFLGDAKLAVRPDAEALVYLCDFILVVEAIYRISVQKTSFGKGFPRQAVIGCSIAVLTFFFVDYVSVIRPHVERHEAIFDTEWRQILATILAFCASLMAFWITNHGPTPRAAVARNTQASAGAPA